MKDFACLFSVHNIIIKIISAFDPYYSNFILISKLSLSFQTQKCQNIIKPKNAWQKNANIYFKNHDIYSKIT